MKIEELMEILDDCCNDVVFRHKGKDAGITATVDKYVTTYQIWYGENTKEFDNSVDVVYDPFFDGESIFDLIKTVEFNVL